MLNIKLDRKKFLNNIKIVENALNEDKADGINSGIYVEAKENVLTLKAFGDSLFIKANMECEVLEAGEFIIKHKLMEEFLRQIDQDIIEIKEYSGKISIISGKNSSEFAIYQYQYKEDVTISSSSEFKFDKEEFLNDIEKVRFAASTTVEKLIVNCLRLEVNNNKFNLVSSDTHRLIYLNKDIEMETDEDLAVSIPLKTINSLIKILRLSLEDKEIVLKTESNKLLFQLDNVDIITKLVDIKYPDYKTLLKNIQSTKFATINAQNFIGILRRISVFVKDNTDKKDIAIFRFLENSLEIEGKNDYATTNEKIDILYEGNDLKIALNVKFILDYLTTSENAKLIELKLNTEKSPVLLNFKDDLSTIYLIAPTQV